MPDYAAVIPPPARRSTGRDARLDFWRGLCLIDMVLVHLVYAEVQFGQFFGTFLTDLTRFAAGGFVFLSGLCMGMIFLPKVIASGEHVWDAKLIYRRIWQRALKLLIVQYISTTFLVLLDVPAGSRAAMGSPWQFAWDLLRFRKGNDLLCLYVGMLAVTPLLLEAVRRRLWPVVVVVSAVLFTYGTYHPWRIAFIPRGEGEGGGEFPLFLWQAVFISGLLFTQPLRAIDRASRRFRAGLLAVLFALFLILMQSANAPELETMGSNLADFGRHPGAHAAAKAIGSVGSTAIRLHVGHPILHVEFTKIPLTVWEFLRYLVTTLLMMLVTNALWKRIKDARLARFICLLGRNSLFVYVAHLFVHEIIAKLSYETWWLGAWQILYGVLMIFILGVLAFWMEQFSKPKKKPTRGGEPEAHPPVLETGLVPS